MSQHSKDLLGDLVGLACIAVIGYFLLWLPYLFEAPTKDAFVACPECLTQAQE